MVKRFLTAAAVFVLAGLLLALTVGMMPSVRINEQQTVRVILFK